MTDTEDLTPEEAAEKAQALIALTARRAESEIMGHINNNLLWAGSPMYYYCVHCGVQTDLLSEGWDPRVTQPKTLCTECKHLLDKGWHDGKMPAFPISNVLSDGPGAPKLKSHST